MEELPPSRWWPDAWHVLIGRASCRRPESPITRLRRVRHVCHPVGEAPRRDGGDHDQHGECRLGQKPRRRCRHRLQETGFREGVEWLRRGREQPGQRHARKIPEGAEARGTTHFHLRSAGHGVRQGERIELAPSASHAPVELRHPKQGQAARHQLLVCFHARNGEQLGKITSLIESGVIRPVVVGLPFQATNERWTIGDGSCKRQSRHQRDETALIGRLKLGVADDA